MTFKMQLAASAALSALALACAGEAYAQSTATQVQEVVVAGRREASSTAGLATQVNEPLDVAIIQKDFIETRAPSANVGQIINALPGVTYTTEDPGGFNSGDLRIHGFDGAHVAVALDGAPLNDTGNYAVYFGEYVIGETIDRIRLNIGSSDVDSPTASALGATLNVTTKVPQNTPGFTVKLSGGSYDYRRGYVELQSGQFGPWGTKAYVGVEYGRNQNWGNDVPGVNHRTNYNFKVYQPLRGTDFISVSGIYSRERQYPRFRLTQAQINQFGTDFYGDAYTFKPETVTPGVADTVPVSDRGLSDSNYYKLFPNPVDFGSIRGQSKFSLLKNLTFTFDPQFFYTLANGGGGATLSEKSAQLIGNGRTATNPTGSAASGASRACTAGGFVTGVDLNGDGDCQDTVVVYRPSNTQTYRWGVTSSLIYDLNSRHQFRLAYTYDYGHHRQTGELTYVDPATGNPYDVFGARPGYGRPIITADGAVLQNRNRLSVAELSQFSASYVGKFLNDDLHVQLGVRAPEFKRHLNQFCYTYNGSSAYCDTIDPTAVQTAYTADAGAATRTPGSTATNLSRVLGTTVRYGASGLPNFRFPGKSDYSYDKVLPNVGASYRLNDLNFFYVGYARGFNAPKTDNLYTSSPNGVQPETSDNFTAGYRFQTRKLNVSFNLYDTEWKNRIVQSVDPNDPTLSIDRNVGDATVRGIDIEVGYTPIENLNLYASANFNDSELKSNYQLASGATTFALPTKGKELVLTPDETLFGRASYRFGPVRLGAEARFTGRRYIDDINSTSIGSTTVVNLDARVDLPYFGGRSYIQVNVQNLFNQSYISRATTDSNYTPYAIPGTALIYSANTPGYYIGAPSTFYLTLNATF